MIINSIVSAVIDSLDSHIAVIDSDGFIHYVNHAWKAFALANGLEKEPDWLSYNYLHVCSQAAKAGDEDAVIVAEGLRNVISNEKPVFFHEYPCHSPDENRWYLLRIAPLKGNPKRFVISHNNVTRNKILEKKAQQLSLEDPLTGLYNRRGLDMFAVKEFARAMRHRVALSMLIIDVDHFKYYNDKYGHQAGDKCLINIAKIIKNNARRPSDIAVRIGGDEFIMLLSQTGKKQAMVIANAIKDKVFDLNMDVSIDRRVTVSIGLTTLIPEKNSNYQDLLYKEADAALYIAKKRRNTVYAIDNI